jgi:hypothetical protein
MIGEVSIIPVPLLGLRGSALPSPRLGSANSRRLGLLWVVLHGFCSKWHTHF